MRNLVTRRRSTAALLVLLTACGAPRTGPRAPIVAFRDLFDAATSVTLATRDDDPLGFPASALVRDADLVIVDQRGANLKMFSRRTGELERTVGTAGDGPGEFRQPLAIAPLDSGHFVVLDQGRRILSFRDSLGAVVEDTPGLRGFFNGLVALPGQRRVILSGVMFAQRGDTKNADLHEFEFGGRRAASYAKTIPVRSKWAEKLNAMFAAQIGEEIVTGALNSNRLRLYDRATGRAKFIDVAPSWYQSLQYPSDALLQRGVSTQTVAQRVSSYIHTQRLMNGVLPLGSGAFLVRFMAFTSPTDKAFYYAVADTNGMTYAITRASRANIVATRGDTAFWVSEGADGTTRLSSGVVARARFEQPAGPAEHRVAAR